MVDAVPCDIVGNFHAIPFEGEETVIIPLFMLCSKRKQITHQTVYFKQKGNFTFTHFIESTLTQSVSFHLISGLILFWKIEMDSHPTNYAQVRQGTADGIIGWLW